MKENCTVLGCDEPGYYTTWLENLALYDVTLCLCRQHHKAFIDLVCPLMRENERAAVRTAQAREDECLFS